MGARQWPSKLVFVWKMHNTRVPCEGGGSIGSIGSGPFPRNFFNQKNRDVHYLIILTQKKKIFIDLFYFGPSPRKKKSRYGPARVQWVFHPVISRYPKRTVMPNGWGWRRIGRCLWKTVGYNNFPRDENLDILSFTVSVVMKRKYKTDSDFARSKCHSFGRCIVVLAVNFKATINRCLRKSRFWASSMGQILNKLFNSKKVSKYSIKLKKKNRWKRLKL